MLERTTSAKYWCCGARATTHPRSLATLRPRRRRESGRAAAAGGGLAIAHVVGVSPSLDDAATIWRVNLLGCHSQRTRLSVPLDPAAGFGQERRIADKVAKIIDFMIGIFDG